MGTFTMPVKRWTARDDVLSSDMAFVPGDLLAKAPSLVTGMDAGANKRMPLLV